MARGLWYEGLKQKIIVMNGSVQEINEIPDDIKAALGKASWELKQRTLIDMAAARGAFICQSQVELFVADSTYSKLTSMHFYSWKKV
jgi:ribonucleotide reductase alpha subunit